MSTDPEPHADTNSAAIVCAAAAITAVVLCIYATSTFGVGVSPDSANYIVAARGLAAGHGLTVNGAPFAHWPPLYPILLAAFALLHVDPLQSARVLGMALSGLNAGIAAWIALRLSGGSKAAALISGLAIAACPEMVRIHAMAWSEPPFLGLAFAGLVTLTTRFALHSARRGGTEGQRKTEGKRGDGLAETRTPGEADETNASHDTETRTYTDAIPEPAVLTSAVSLGLLVGCAGLTRYAGITLIIPFALCLWWLGSRTGPARIRAVVGFVCAAVAPLALWLIYLRLGAHTVSDRPIAFHPPHSAAWLLLPAAVLMGIAAARRFQQPIETPYDGANVITLWIYAFLSVYCVFVLVSMMFVDASVPLDGRILTPVIAFGMLALVRPVQNAMLAATLKGGAQWSGVCRTIAWTALLVFGARGIQGAMVAKEFHDRGNGYTGQVWSDSHALAWTEALPQGVVLYSNAPEIIAFRCNHTARPFPSKYSTTSLAPNTHVDDDIAEFVNAMRHGAIAIYFPGDPRSYLLSPADLESRCHLAPILDLGDAIVYARTTP